MKVEYKDRKRAEAKAEKAGLLAAPVAKREEPLFVSLAEEDPNLALAALRIEIEKRLRAIAASQGIREDARGLISLIRGLRKVEAISSQDESVIRDLIGLLNNAVHGAEVDERSAEWAIDVGPELLAAVEKRLG